MDEIQGWKLIRVRKDGTLGTLFINRRQVITPGVWMPAEDHKTKGFEHRPGWHATLERRAPHLKETLASGEKRVWVRVMLRGTRFYNRPESQGGTWVLAEEMMVMP